jgi:hypothetical protein
LLLAFVLAVGNKAGSLPIRLARVR